MKFYGIFSEGSRINQILCAILINLPVLAYGASIGWMSPMTLLLQSQDSPRGEPLTDAEVSWVAAIAYCVCVPCNSLLAIIGDKVGRKKVLLIVSAASAASWLLLICSFNLWAIVLARALVGITMAGAYVICPIYTKEISDERLRGALGCLINLFHTTGNLFLYVVGDLLSYTTINCICLAIPTVHLVVFLFMPESPSFLVKKERIEDATKIIAWLRCKPESDLKVQEELNLLIKEKKHDEEANKFLLKNIFTDKILSKAFQIAMVASLAREVCGAIPVLNFAGDIFTLASRDGGILLSPNQQAMMLGAVQVVGSTLASSVVEKSGRKPLLFLSSLMSGLSMCALASWFLMRELGMHTPSWIPLTTLCICIFCDASGLLPMSMVVTGEIFSFKYRGTVVATTMTCASLSCFLQLLFFKPLANSIGIHVAFYFFGVVCLLMAVYVIFVIPETKARSLEDIYEDLGKKHVKITKKIVSNKNEIGKANEIVK